MQPVRLKFSQHPIQIARDDNGVPHITAPSWPHALYGLGYMHAMDRATQLLFSRVIASGRSAELIADRPELRQTDRLFRQVGLYRGLEREFAELDPDDQQLLATYCDGVNDGMQQAGRSLPMWAVGFQPQPWDPLSVMLIGNLLNYAGLAIGQQQSERVIVELIQAGVGDQRLREMFAPLLDDADFELLRRVRISSRLSDESLEVIADLPRLAGSNAWAIAPHRSATGSALLASDPHLEINRLPAIWYEAVLRWEDEYLMGATLPGTPDCAIGRTRRLSWGVTYLKGDSSDFFIEDCRQQEDRWQYRRGDAWHDFEVRDETILRRGAPPEQQRVFTSDVGVIDGDLDELRAGLHLSIAWTGLDPGVGRAVAAWLKLPKFKDAKSALEFVRHCPQPSLCWIIADADGHIGWQSNGLFPERPPHINGLYPVPAWDVNNHWRGRIDPARMPGAYDPPEGFVASANENLNPPQGPQLVTAPTPGYRKRRIVQRLAELPQATLADMQALQYDVISLQARDLLPVFLPHLPEGPLKDELSDWDYSYAPASRKPSIFNRLYTQVLLEIFGQEPHELGGIGWRRMVYLSTRAGFSMMMIAAVDRVLMQERSLWWEQRDKGELIRRAAERVNVDACPPWSQVNAFRFTNRYFEGNLVGRALGFHTRDLPMPGCFATPFQGHLLRVATRETSFAPSYHFVTDLAQDEAFTNLPGGPSESRFSRWYRSDIPRWCSGQYKRLAPQQS